MKNDFEEEINDEIVKYIEEVKDISKFINDSFDNLEKENNDDKIN